MKKVDLNKYFIFLKGLNLDEKIEKAFHENHSFVDKVMFRLVLIHWGFAAMIFPLVYSNFSLGFYGGALLSFSSFLAYREFRGTTISRFILSTSLVLFTFIFIQQSLGKIETHFHFWMVLGMVLAYKDIRPVLWTSAIIVLHHGVFTLCQGFDITIAGQPLIIYESGASLTTLLLHAFFVVPSTVLYSLLGSINIKDFIKSEEQNITIEEQLIKNEKIHEAIKDQNKTLMEMSVPATQLWNGILLLPLVGILDSRRAQEIMTSMLEKIVTNQSEVLILDISGISVVDTAVANYLIKFTKVTKLMGCDCIISGVSRSIAQTIVELGIPVDKVNTTGNMQDALDRALKLTGAKIEMLE